jgi:5-methylcytosine-specific restriction endonuclease McrA
MKGIRMLFENLRKFNDDELHVATVKQAKHEQAATLDLLYHLAEVRRRRLYGVLGFSSLWEYVRSLGYSDSGTGERVRAMELLVGNEAVVARKLRTNELSLTTASQIQIHVRKMNQNNHRVTEADTLKLIEAASGKTKRDVESMLLEHTPAELRPIVLPERVRQLSAELQEVRIIIDTEMQELIRRYKELRGEGSLLDIFKEALREAVRRKDPLARGAPSSASNSKLFQSGKSVGVTALPPRALSRHVPEASRRFVFQRAGGQCEHVTSEGTRCQSRYRLEIDHIVPFSVTGSHAIENLRALCPTHNKASAIDFYGWKKMGPYLEKNPA